MPNDFIGTWTAEITPIQVRETTGFMQFDFTKGEIDAELNIKHDKSVRGKIGDHDFENGYVSKSNIYKIVIDDTQELFTGDPTRNQQLSFWIFDSITTQFQAELCLTEKGSKYPMGELSFVKSE